MSDIAVRLVTVDTTTVNRERERGQLILTGAVEEYQTHYDNPAGTRLLVPVEPYINALFDALCESEGSRDERLLEAVDALMDAIGQHCPTCGGSGETKKFGNKVYVDGQCPACSGRGWVLAEGGGDE